MKLLERISGSMERLTIDEWIETSKLNAKVNREHPTDEMLLQEAEEYEQLAEWLEELKMYKSLAPRELVSQKQRNDRNAEYHKGFNDGYNKAIDKFIDALEYVFGTDDEVVIEMYDLRETAKQLKAGGKNGK